VLFLQAYQSESIVFRFFALIPVFFIIIMLSFGVYVLIGLLIWNTRTVLKKERRSLKHCLALIFAVALLLVLIAPRIVDLSGFPRLVAYLTASAYGLMVFYFLHFSQFIISLALCNLYRPQKNQDYLIVHGCATKEGKVTPLLGQRIERAISFYNKQKEKSKPPRIVMSGGQGVDESCPEAETMRMYALDKGIPDKDLLLEANSKSTFENMKFSKEIMDRESEGKPYKCIFVTSNYHVLRAGILAKRAGLRIDGIGARTAFYYLPNAILREYIAYLYLYFKWNVVLSAISLVVGSVVMYIMVEKFGIII
jgi:uncharacterized SAM-binding protein YcdF (DUF218 family)